VNALNSAGAYATDLSAVVRAIEGMYEGGRYIGRPVDKYAEV
jgi:hypothetical protein